MKSIRNKIAVTFVSVSIVSVLILSWFITNHIEQYTTNLIAKNLETYINTFIVAFDDEEGLFHEVERFSKTTLCRITLIDSTGVVLADSDVDSARVPMMDNHGTRPEVLEAKKAGWGMSIRFSHTLNKNLLYVAKLAPETLTPVQFVRFAKPLSEIDRLKSGIRITIALVTGAIIVFIVVVGIVISTRISRPILAISRAAQDIQRGNFNTRVTITTKDEIGELAEAVNSLADKLLADLDKLKKLEKVRTEFFGNVTHELKTPISIIRGYLETLQEEKLCDENPVIRNFLEKALSNTRRLEALVTDLVQISRIESGEMKMRFRNFDIIETIKERISDFTREAEKKKLIVKVDFPESDSLIVYGDKARIVQVLNNLFSNAIRYTDKGKITIKVNKDDQWAYISVEDTGIGISEKDLPRIFERFYRIDKTRSRETGGTGLGLAIVKHIIEAHGGTVKVESEVGKGSIFTFSVKLGKES